jgi:hypothetical protein
MKAQNFAKLLAVVTILTAFAAIASAATMYQRSMTELCPSPISNTMK